MIDYDKPDDDPVVAEVRRAREEIAAGFDFNLEQPARRCSAGRQRLVGGTLQHRRARSKQGPRGRRRRRGNQPRSLSMLSRRPTRTAADAASTCPSG